MTLIQILGLISFAGVFSLVLTSTDFKQLKVDKGLQHRVFGAAASVFTLWIFRTGIYDGLTVHFLWLSALTLTLGFRWAVIAASAVLLGITTIGKESWSMLGVNGLIGVLVPIASTYAIFSLVFHKLPKNFFVYVFLCGFLPGALMIALKMTLLGGYYYADGFHDWMTIKDNYLILITLLLFPEGMLNGMTMTLLIIYKPNWVYTFNDKFYINNK